MRSDRREVTLRDLVSHVERRVQRKAQLIHEIATLPPSPKRSYAEGRLVDVLKDLAAIRELVTR